MNLPPQGCATFVFGALLRLVWPGTEAWAWASDEAARPGDAHTSAAAATAVELHATLSAVTLAGGFESGPFGEAIPVWLGVESVGTKSAAHRRLVVSWDARGGVVGGYGGNEHPGFWFGGSDLDAAAELGYRLLGPADLSPVVAAGGAVDWTAVSVLSHQAGGASAMNDLDGFAGSTGWAATRWGLGASYLTSRDALEILAFAQEAARAPATWSDVSLYLEVGVRVHYDLAHSLRLTAQGSYGRAQSRFDRAFGFAEVPSHTEATLDVKKVFAKGFWIGLRTRLARDGRETVYSSVGTTYVTWGLPSATASLSLGVLIE
jgi:hypothetical protein